MRERLEDLAGQWGRALQSLPDRELAAQREAARAACEGRSGTSPAALILSLLDAEQARREAGK